MERDGTGLQVFADERFVEAGFRGDFAKRLRGGLGIRLFHGGESLDDDERIFGVSGKNGSGGRVHVAPLRDGRAHRGVERCRQSRVVSKKRAAAPGGSFGSDGNAALRGETGEV